MQVYNATKIVKNKKFYNLKNFEYFFFALSTIVES